MNSIYTVDAARERDAAERTEAMADEHDRDAARYDGNEVNRMWVERDIDEEREKMDAAKALGVTAPPPHTLERIVHAQFQAFMLEVAVAGLYLKEHEFHAIDANALALKCEAFCDSLAMMQTDAVTALAAD